MRKLYLFGTNVLLKGAVTAIPLDAKEIVTVQEVSLSNMLEIGALHEPLFGKELITKEEFIARYKKLDREMKAKRGKEAKILKEVLQ